MEQLTRRHITFLYLTESLFFTKWPYVASESLLSPTNLMGPVALFGIACLLYSYVQLCIHGRHGDKSFWWQCTTTVSKVAALSYWSSRWLVLALLVVSTFSTNVWGTTRFWEQVARIKSLDRALYVLDCVFISYVVTAALFNESGVYVLLYIMYYIFLRSYSEITYVFTHLYFLILFAILY